MLVGFRCINATKVSLFIKTTFEHDMVGKVLVFNLEIVNLWFLMWPSSLTYVSTPFFLSQSKLLMIDNLSAAPEAEGNRTHRWTMS